jgi:hypothetical protein
MKWSAFTANLPPDVQTILPALAADGMRAAQIAARHAAEDGPVNAVHTRIAAAITKLTAARAVIATGAAPEGTTAPPGGPAEASAERWQAYLARVSTAHRRAVAVALREAVQAAERAWQVIRDDGQVEDFQEHSAEALAWLMNLSEMLASATPRRCGEGAAPGPADEDAPAHAP